MPATAPTAAVGGAAGDRRPTTARSASARATVEQLDTIEGIGPVTAQKIVDFRDQHGGFSSVDELDQIPGIGPATMEALRDRAPALSRGSRRHVGLAGLAPGSPRRQLLAPAARPLAAARLGAAGLAAAGGHAGRGPRCGARRAGSPGRGSPRALGLGAERAGCGDRRGRLAGRPAAAHRSAASSPRVPRRSRRRGPVRVQTPQGQAAGRRPRAGARARRSARADRRPAARSSRRPIWRATSCAGTASPRSCAPRSISRSAGAAAASPGARRVSARAPRPRSARDSPASAALPRGFVLGAGRPHRRARRATIQAARASPTCSRSAARTSSCSRSSPPPRCRCSGVGLRARLLTILVLIARLRAGHRRRALDPAGRGDGRRRGRRPPSPAARGRAGTRVLLAAAVTLGARPARGRRRRLAAELRRGGRASCCSRRRSRGCSPARARAAAARVAEGAALTVAATVATAPLMSLRLRRVSLVTLPANLLALPPTRR